MKWATIIGGGTGLPVVAKGLVAYPHVRINCILTPFDDGGSTGWARRQFKGQIGTSDLINALLALHGDRADQLMVRLLRHRFHEGELFGQRMSTLIFAGHAMETEGDGEDALRSTLVALHKTLDVYPNAVHPSTFTDALLVAVLNHDAGDQRVVGEHNIDVAYGITEEDHRIRSLELESKEGDITANTEALKAVQSADLLVLGPGSLHTSLLCNLIVPGIREEIDQTDCPIVYVVNLTTRWGDTHSLDARGHVDLVNSYLGERKITHVIINNDFDIPPWVTRLYAEQNASVVRNDLENCPETVIQADLYSSNIHRNSTADLTPRSALRHDPHALAKAIMSIL